MRKNKVIDLFGVTYEIHQFSAIDAFEMVDDISILTPLELLSECYVIKYDGSKVRLNSEKVISEEVKSIPNHLPPNLVLKVLMEAVKKHNFGFLSDWKGTKIPNRFLADAPTVEPNYLEPMVASLINNGLDSLKELEEYYSLRYAFAMFDGLIAKSLNEAYSNEAAIKESKSNR